jgi:hypothetical protein
MSPEQRVNLKLPEDIVSSSDYVDFIRPWKDNPEFISTVESLLELLLKEQKGEITEEEIDVKIDMIVDTPIGEIFCRDDRYIGSGIHSLRQIASGVALEHRKPVFRGVNDKSGKKG